MRPSADMFNLRIRVRSRKKREYLQNGSSNPSGKWCNRIFGSFLRRKQLTTSIVRADHPKVPLPPKITTVSWKKRKTCKKREVNLTSPSQDIVPQSLGFTCNCIRSLNFKPSYLKTVFSTSAPLPEELA